MQIYVTKNGQQFGPYTVSEVRQHIESGSFDQSDFGWYDGVTDWLPLSSIPEVASGFRSTITTPPPLRPPPPPSGSVPQSSGLAISSLVLGILAFFSIGLTAIPAVICGHLSLSRIKRSLGAIAGRGMAIAGLVLGYLWISVFALAFMIALIAGISLPVFSSVQDRAKETKSLANARQIGLGCKLYASDHHGSFPPNLDELVPSYIPVRSLFVSPFAEDKSEISYEYTPDLTEKSPPNQVLLRDKYASRRGYRAVVYVDMSGQVTRDP